MHSDDKFWATISGLFIILVLGLTSLGTTYWTDHNNKIVQLIEKGVDPVEVMCAMQDDYGNNPVCLISASKKPNN